MSVLALHISTNVIAYANSDTDFLKSVESTINIDVENKGKTVSKEGNKDNLNNTIVTDVAEVLGLEVDNKDTYSLIFGEELSNFGIVLASNDSEYELNNRFDYLNEITQADLSGAKVVEVLNDEESKSMESELEYQAKLARLKEMQNNVLLEIAEPDENYKGTIVRLTEEDRYILEHLVMGEAGNQGMIGAALVAQAIRDTMVYRGFDTVESVRKSLKYSGSLNKKPNQDVLDAVSYIFDDGGCAVKHTVFYFYAPKVVSSPFHESQHFVVEYGGHRFFSVNKN